MMGQHQRFLERVRQSHAAVFAVAEYYHNLGKEYSVQIAALRLAPTAADAPEYSDDGDLILNRLIVEQWKGGGVFWRWRVEVKHRPDIPFTCAADYPYDTIMVAKQESVDKADDAATYVTVSADLRYGAFIPIRTRPVWKEMECRAGNTGNIERQYLCPKPLARFERLAP